MHRDAGDHVVANGDLYGVGSSLDPHSPGLDDARAPQRDDGLGGGEGQLGEDSRGLSRPVFLAVGNQGDGFLFEAPVLGAFFSGHPERHLALVPAPFRIGDDRPQQVGAAGQGGEDRLDGLLARGHLLAGDNFIFLQPGAFFLYPALADTEEFEGLPSEDLAVDVGDDRFDAQGLPLVDEGLLAAQADVAVRGVDKQRRRRAPALAVDVADARPGREGRGPRRLDRLEPEAEAVEAGIVGLAGKGFGLSLGTAKTSSEVPVKAPPGNPGSEDEVGVAGR